jgi:hypothetical protein
MIDLWPCLTRQILWENMKCVAGYDQSHTIGNGAAALMQQLC